MNRAIVGFALAIVLALSGPAHAQYAYPPPDAPPPGAPPPGAVQPLYAPQQLDQMLASIALYPDPLLTALLTASTYPLEVVEADRWVSSPPNAVLAGGALAAALEAQGWDPSVKSLVPLPQILHMMDAHLDWTQALGNAFLAQQADMMDSIQRLRHAALAAGTLASTAQQAVIIAGSYIRIEPVNPELVYIPVYNPTVIYGRWPYPAYLPIYYGPPPGLVYQVAPAGLGFGVGIVVVDVLWHWSHWDWPRHRIDLDRDRFNRINVGRPPVAATVWRHDPDHRRGTPDRGTSGARLPGAAQPPRQATVPPPAAPNQVHGPQSKPHDEPRREQTHVAPPAVAAPAAPVQPATPMPPAAAARQEPHPAPPQARVSPPQIHPVQPMPAPVQPMQQSPVQPMQQSPVQPMQQSPVQQTPQAAVAPQRANAPPHPARPAPKPPAPAAQPAPPAADASPSGRPERRQRSEDRHE